MEILRQAVVQTDRGEEWAFILDEEGRLNFCRREKGEPVEQIRNFTVAAGDNRVYLVTVDERKRVGCWEWDGEGWEGVYLTPAKEGVGTPGAPLACRSDSGILHVIFPLDLQGERWQILHYKNQGGSWVSKEILVEGGGAPPYGLALAGEREDNLCLTYLIEGEEGRGGLFYRPLQKSRTLPSFPLSLGKVLGAPAILVDIKGITHVVWQEKNHSSSSLLYRRKDPNAEWSPTVLIRSIPVAPVFPALSWEQGALHLYWHEEDRVLSCRSWDEGDTWVQEATFLPPAGSPWALLQVAGQTKAWGNKIYGVLDPGVKLITKGAGEKADKEKKAEGHEKRQDSAAALKKALEEEMTRNRELLHREIAAGLSSFLNQWEEHRAKSPSPAEKNPPHPGEGGNAPEKGLREGKELAAAIAGMERVIVELSHQVKELAKENSALRAHFRQEQRKGGVRVTRN